MGLRTALAVAITVVLVTAGCMSTQDTSTNGGKVDDTLSTPISDSHMTSLVYGKIVFKSSRPELTGTKVYVRLEDVSRADASAHIVSEQMIEDPADHISVEGISFVLSGNQSDIDPQKRYSVSAHIDMDGNREVSAGDYISTENNPVLTQGHSNRVTVMVEQID